MGRSILGLVFVFAAALASIADDATDSRPVARVLIVYENESTLAAAMEVAQGLHKGFAARFPTRFEIYSEYLDIVRFPGQDRIDRLATDITAKYADVSLDAILAVGPGALRFMLDKRSRLPVGVPLIFGAVNENRLDTKTLPADVRGVLSHFDVSKTIDLARQLQPDARRVVVVTGTSDFDKSWEKLARETLSAHHPDFGAEYLTGLTLEGFKTKVREFSTETILLILTVFQDAGGRKYIPRDAATEIAAASGAPSYGVYSTYVGAGVLGGYVETFESIGEDMAALTEQVAADAASAPQLIRSTGRPLVDWRQLKRWGIDRARLPPGAELRFYEPSAWERYRLQILATLGVVILQTGMIAALIIQGQRRRRAERQLAQERLELAHMSRTSQLGELSGAFAHELNQPLTSILANAEAGTRLLDRNPPATHELKEIFGDIVDDDKRAADFIAQLHRLMVKGEAKLDQMDLNEAATETAALLNSELVTRQTKLDLDLEQPELLVRGNLVQLQQVILNLIMNSTEAMASMAPSERQIDLRTRRREDGYCELTISDRGPGLSPEMRVNAFEPFVSTKAKGLGLGLAICRSIAQAHGGALEFDEHAEQGARVIFTLPLS